MQHQIYRDTVLAAIAIVIALSPTGAALGQQFQAPTAAAGAQGQNVQQATFSMY